MDSKKVKAKPIRKITTKQVVLDFEAERLRAPFLLRAGALLIDYIILVLIPVASMLLARWMGDDGAKLLNSEINNTGWLITILLGLTNFVILPMFSGQSIGKMFTGLRIVSSDGTGASFSKLLLRHLVGYPLTICTFGLGFLFSIFNEKGLALHDYLAGTIVVFGQRRIEKKIAESKRKKSLTSNKSTKRLATVEPGT